MTSPNTPAGGARSTHSQLRQLADTLVNPRAVMASLHEQQFIAAVAAAALHPAIWSVRPVNVCRV